MNDDRSSFLNFQVRACLSERLMMIHTVIPMDGRIAISQKISSHRC